MRVVNKRKYYIVIITLSVALVTSIFFHIIFKLKINNEFIDRIKPEVELIRTAFEEYQFVDEIHFPPKNLEEVKNILDWSKKKGLIHNLEILNLGFNIKFDSISNNYIVYSFGLNRKDDKLKNILNNGVDEEGFFYIKKMDLFEFISSSSENDIILFNIKKQDRPAGADLLRPSRNN